MGLCKLPCKRGKVAPLYDLEDEAQSQTSAVEVSTDVPLELTDETDVFFAFGDEMVFEVPIAVDPEVPVAPPEEKAIEKAPKQGCCDCLKFCCGKGNVEAASSQDSAVEKVVEKPFEPTIEVVIEKPAEEKPAEEKTIEESPKRGWCDCLKFSCGKGNVETANAEEPAIVEDVEKPVDEPAVEKPVEEKSPEEKPTEETPKRGWCDYLKFCCGKSKVKEASPEEPAIKEVEEKPVKEKCPEVSVTMPEEEITPETVKRRWYHYLKDKLCSGAKPVVPEETVEAALEDEEVEMVREVRKNGFSWRPHNIQLGTYSLVAYFEAATHTLLLGVPGYHIYLVVQDLILAGVVIASIYTMQRNPAVDCIKDKTEVPADRDILVIGERHCPTCEIYVPLRTKHCRFCNKCVELFDHHCFVANNCIGKDNYRGFLAMLLTTLLFLTCVLVASGTAIGLYYYLDFDPKLGPIGIDYRLWISLNAITMALASIPLGYFMWLASFQYRARKRGLTQYEYRRHLSALKRKAEEEADIPTVVISSG